jgi:hypothetical protein
VGILEPSSGQVADDIQTAAKHLRMLAVAAGGSVASCLWLRMVCEKLKSSRAIYRWTKGRGSSVALCRRWSLRSTCEINRFGY